MSKSIASSVLLVGAILLAILLPGCSDEPTPSPVAKVPPSSTATPTSVPTATGSATLTPTQTATPTPPPIVITGPQIYGNNVFVLPVAENLAINLYDAPLTEYAARFYEYFNDEFDFLVFVGNVNSVQLEPGTPHGGYYSGVNNDVEGIGGGSAICSNRSWGFGEKLQGMIYIDTYDAIDRGEGRSQIPALLIHEFMHRWANYVIPPFPHDAHLPFMSEACVLGIDISTMIDHGDGRYSSPPYDWSSRGQYCPLELYLAGFIGPEDVPDFRVAVDAEWPKGELGGVTLDDNGYQVFTASGFETYTIDDIIAEHGPRVPDSSQAQKDFRAAVVLQVSTDYPATPLTLDTLSYDVSWFSHPGERDHKSNQEKYQYANFYQYTGGRGTITMDGLSEFLKDGE